jgi:hypothetical protein
MIFKNRVIIEKTESPMFQHSRIAKKILAQSLAIEFLHEYSSESDQTSLPDAKNHGKTNRNPQNLGSHFTIVATQCKQ